MLVEEKEILFLTAGIELPRERDAYQRYMQYLKLNVWDMGVFLQHHSSTEFLEEFGQFLLSPPLSFITKLMTTCVNLLKTLMIFIDMFT